MAPAGPSSAGNPLKSPMLGSPSSLKSPQTPSQLAGILTGPPVAVATPHDGLRRGLPSPGIPQSNKPPLGLASPNMMGPVEQGGNGPPSAPPPLRPARLHDRPGGAPSGGPYGLPPEPTLSQNPLSIMMSRMSKFAMPSSTPLYHDAIKTVASSDDESPPARSPNLPSISNSMQGMGVNHHPGHPRMMVPNSEADLHEVIRPGASGIPEFDLSRIIPSDKPSQTLSYFPRGGEGGKGPPGLRPDAGHDGGGAPPGHAHG
ncbi:hypothetical protein AAFF_G00132290 [Aldrovandia affinis]|uniref:Uncharacterized protein n=1 Tax=Aldrovandia affinis TaxID=143900 RepID=A0AAD7W9L6_9TELE|nr:hypothetical protein AAFF_G00132290 [Aldrovandia affinis]